jgi:GNAT superfamily N-acetyltransferase
MLAGRNQRENLLAQWLVDRHPGGMPFVRVNAGDAAAIQVLTDLYNAARAVDDPTSPPAIAELVAGDVEFGWDLHPEVRYLYTPPGGDQPVGALGIDLPVYDNLQLVWAEVLVHPDHRRQGHGTAIMEEVLRQAREAGRTIIWVGTAEDDLGAQAFVAKFGFGYASHDARRRQRLAEVDHDELDRLHAQAIEAAKDYRLERLRSPVPDEVLAELIEVTAAINDAPGGTLTYEDEVFDVTRLREVETARQKRGDLMYRIVARHKETGEAAGHTVVVFNPLRPQRAGQGDTAVARTHRGHRLGLLLKIDMMHWLAEEQPQLEEIETWNHADNAYMINVNEAIGYRLSRIFNMYELKLEGAKPYAKPAQTEAVAVS